MGRKASAATPAIVALQRAAVAHTIHSYEHDERSQSYGTEAAEALGIDPARVFKTLMAEADGELVVAVVPVSGRLDLKALAGALGAKKAALADPSAAEKATGYVVGGISPLGQKRRLRTAIDQSALDFPTINVSAGRRGLEIELAGSDLQRLTGATLAALARP